MIDVLKVDRRGDQTGVMLRGRIRETRLSKQQKGEKGNEVTKMEALDTRDISHNMHVKKMN